MLKNVQRPFYRKICKERSTISFDGLANLNNFENISSSYDDYGSESSVPTVPVTEISETVKNSTRKYE